MKKTLQVIGALAVLLPAGLGWTGCGRNEAREDESLRAAPAPSGPAVADQRERALAEREAELARREQALEEVENQLTARMERIADRVEELESGEARPGEREARVEPAETAGRDEPVLEAVPRPDPEPPPVPRPVARTVVVSLPPATALAVEFEHALSSETSLVGDHFRALVVRDVSRDGLVAIPAGTEVRGSVASIVPQKKIGGQARLTLSFDRLFLPSGDSVDIDAVWEVAGKSQKKRDAATIGGSAAGGAILGRVLSDKKGKGTAIGAIVGAAIGTAVASENAGDPAFVEPGMVAEVALVSPVEVAVVVEEADDLALARNR